MDSSTVKPASAVKRRRRASLNKADLLRVLQAAQAQGWTHVEITRPCGTVIALRRGAEPVDSRPAGRGLSIVP
jgi:hypothetical protein